MQGADGPPPAPVPPRPPPWVSGDGMMAPDGADGLFLFEEGESCRRQVC